MRKFYLLFIIYYLLFTACTFDYGDQNGAELGLPDIVMENVEYVRIRSSDPQARFLAERVERFEDRRIMHLLNFSFEQFGNRGEEVNAYGRAGMGFVNTDSSDVHMSNMVRIEVETEDIIIETSWLQWRDSERVLYGGDSEEVIILQDNGTTFTGIGFRADARRRTWEFSGGASGVFVHEDEEEEEESLDPENETEDNTE